MTDAVICFIEREEEREKELLFMSLDEMYGWKQCMNSAAVAVEYKKRPRKINFVLFF